MFFKTSVKIRTKAFDENTSCWIQSVSSSPSTVVLHERGPLFRILGPPKQQVSNIFKKFQSAGRSLLMIHENLHFSTQILHNFFKIFCSVFPEKFMKNHFHFTNLFTGLGFSTCTFLWNQAS